MQSVRTLNNRPGLQARISFSAGPGMDQVTPEEGSTVRSAPEFVRPLEELLMEEPESDEDTDDEEDTDLGENTDDPEEADEEDDEEADDESTPPAQASATNRELLLAQQGLISMGQAPLLPAPLRD